MENILNIINFIRGAEPRNRSIDLVEPVRRQIALMKEYGLPGTFLLQYDKTISFKDVCTALCTITCCFLFKYNSRNYLKNL